jgi:hypothetical protein
VNAIRSSHLCGRDGLGGDHSDELGYTVGRTTSGGVIGATLEVAGVYGTPVLVHGIGQTAGSLSSDAPPGGTGHSGLMQASHGHPVLLAEGNYSRTLGFAGSNNAADVFVSGGSYSTESAVIESETVTLT